MTRRPSLDAYRNDEYWNIYFDLLENIKEALDANAIDIPYPQMDIRVQQIASSLNTVFADRITN